MVFDSLNKMEDYLKNKLTNYENNNRMYVADFKSIEINNNFKIYSRMSSDGQITLIMGVCFDVMNRKWFWWTPRTEHIEGIYDFLKFFTKIEKNNTRVIKNG